MSGAAVEGEVAVAGTAVAGVGGGELEPDGRVHLSRGEGGHPAERSAAWQATRWGATGGAPRGVG